jgi:hypothetical protein
MWSLSSRCGKGVGLPAMRRPWTKSYGGALAQVLKPSPKNLDENPSADGRRPGHPLSTLSDVMRSALSGQQSGLKRDHRRSWCSKTPDDALSRRLSATDTDFGSISE